MKHEEESDSPLDERPSSEKIKWVVELIDNRI
jgi:hypothetical protein